MINTRIITTPGGRKIDLSEGTDYVLERVPLQGEYVIIDGQWCSVQAVGTDPTSGRVYLLVPTS